MLQAAVRSLPERLAFGEYPLPKAHSDRQDSALPADDRQQADLGSHLIVSPYTTSPHLLDLRTLEEPQTLLVKALSVLESVREDYATAPYNASFNWDTVLDQLKSQLQHSKYQWKRQHFYIVVFRSQVAPTTDRTHLGELDQKSHAEATKSGGLLKYWFGLPDQNGRNLATCKPPSPIATRQRLTLQTRHMARSQRRPPRQPRPQPQRSHARDQEHVHGMEARAATVRDRGRRAGMEHHAVGRVREITLRIEA